MLTISLFLLPIPHAQCCDQVVNKFTETENAGPKQKSHEATHFTKQTRQSEGFLLTDRLIAQFLVEDINQEKVFPVQIKNTI